MEWVVLPEPAASARTRFEECIDMVRRCPHDPVCLEAYLAAAASFQFHMTIMEMALIRYWMRSIGMTYKAEPLPFPRWPFTSLEHWRGADQAERAAYTLADRAASAQVVPGMAGIPEFKLRSNGPWIVGAQEIGETLIAYDLADADARAEAEADPLWLAWLTWLRETEQHGGFHVT